RHAVVDQLRNKAIRCQRARYAIFFLPIDEVGEAQLTCLVVVQCNEEIPGRYQLPDDAMYLPEQCHEIVVQLCRVGDGVTCFALSVGSLACPRVPATPPTELPTLRAARRPVDVNHMTILVNVAILEAGVRAAATDVMYV